MINVCIFIVGEEARVGRASGSFLSSSSSPFAAWLCSFFLFLFFYSPLSFFKLLLFHSATSSLHHPRRCR